jgi:Superfamily II DNA/RNA helicase required for DNA uptake (late competence protein)
MIGVHKQHGRYYCNRCGNTKQRYFANYFDMYLSKTMTYCRLCTNENQANTVEELCATKTKLGAMEDFALTLPFPLTQYQKQAVWHIRGYLQAGCFLMLQAVCGAGKTEIMVAVIARYLKAQKTVGWAIARRDVVIEIAARLKEYFPKTAIIALYQDSPDLDKAGQLIVLTTARVYDFYQFFDLLIIDENDAFPFSIDERQKFAARQSVVPTGMSIHISATVETRAKRDYDYIESLAYRFHKFMLPTITFQYYNLQKDLRTNKLSKAVRAKLDMWQAQQLPVFIFVSNKKLGRDFTKILQQYYQPQRVQFVSSDIVDRTPILQAVHAGELSILVTTTILERGVTYKGLQVIVLDADATIFDAQTLIQIAGRVGRNIAMPTGEIIFCYQNNYTNAMKKARLYHQKANQGEVIFL